MAAQIDNSSGHFPAFERRADGSVIVKAAEELAPYPISLTDRLAEWAANAPDRVFLAERGANGDWGAISYAQAWKRILRISQGLVDRDASVNHPVAVLSGNSVQHALLALAAMHIGVPFAPISPAYSLLSSDFARLRHVLSLLAPGIVYAADGKSYARALQSAVHPEARFVVGENPARFHSWEAFDELERREPGPQVEEMHSRVNADTVAKLLFTSGSTGQPKGVINTQRMLCSNQQGIAQSMTFLTQQHPVLVDWLPWHHTFGGNHNFGIALYNGGSLYVDRGKPLGDGVQETVRNLRDVAPTVYFNVPRGYDMLIPFLRADSKFRDHFFSRMDALFSAAAAMSPHTWNALCELSRESRSAAVPIITGIGSTETAPGFLCTRGSEDRPGLLGFPMAGLQAKLVLVGPKLELRAKGPNVMPGYWRDPERTKAAFDEEGYYCMGDAVRLVDANDPGRGIEFNGRIAEDFKMSSGTWVNVERLRLGLIEQGAPLVRDVVIAGHDRDYLVALIIPNIEACREYCGELPAEATAGEIVNHSRARAVFQEILEDFAKKSTGSATRIVRAILLEEPLSADAGEVTDKGSTNQRAVLERRVAIVEECYETERSSRVFQIRSRE